MAEPSKTVNVTVRTHDDRVVVYEVDRAAQASPRPQIRPDVRQRQR